MAGIFKALVKGRMRNMRKHLNYILMTSPQDSLMTVFKCYFLKSRAIADNE